MATVAAPSGTCGARHGLILRPRQRQGKKNLECPGFPRFPPVSPRGFADSARQASGVSVPARTADANALPRFRILSYTVLMKHTDIPSSAAAFIGHVKNGVVVLDAQVALKDGQAVRVEPLGQKAETPLDAERAGRVRQLQQLFDKWTEEDGNLSDEEADRLRTALEQNRGLSFGTPTLD